MSNNLSTIVKINKVETKEETKQEVFISEVSRALSTIGRTLVDSNGTSMYESVRYVEQDKELISDYISDAFRVICKHFERYTVIKPTISTTDKVISSDLEFNIPNTTNRFDSSSLKSIHIGLAQFVIRYVVAKRLEGIDKTAFDSNMAAAMIYLEEAKNNLFIKKAPVFPPETE